MPESMPEQRSAPVLPPSVTLLTLAAASLAFAASVATWLDLRGRIASLEARTEAAGRSQERLERAVQLFRFERGSKGLGVVALIEQIRFWAPLLELSTTPQRELPMIQQRVDDILTALDDVGRDAFNPLHAEFLSARHGPDDELISWLLTAMSRVDPERGNDVLAVCVRGLEVPVSPRVRVHAARRLLQVDRPRTARLLADILTYESAAGVDRQRLPPDLLQKLTAAKTPPPPMRMFDSFVDLLVEAGPNDVDDLLIMTASRPNQDRMTVQTCVKHLGNLKSKRAVKLLKKLFDAPPEMTINPIFQNHCLDAIAKIEGAAACDYFRTMLRAAPADTVQAKLQDLIKNHCP